ncbi:hypothetical protein [Microbulbifer discodermiae]|uniref:hypothetical protein n=1 Tax=Microbulbifer sp. 2201CG32-9 TaxID=3232309 RepID=UPI00345C36A3
MHELHRAEYLQALGVSSYRPRFLLPLAPVPRQATLPPPPEDAPASDPLPQAVAQVMSEVSVPPSPPAEAGTAQEERGRETSASGQSADVTPSAGQAVEPFVLNCWWLGDALLAVDGHQPGAALPVQSLFDNIVRALGWHQLPRDREQLRWPLTENRFAAAAAESDARDTCSSWLEAASARRPVNSIWLMGQQAQAYCSPVRLDGPVTEWKGTRILATPGLSELLQAPERKRDLWLLLRQTYPQQC